MTARWRLLRFCLGLIGALACMLAAFVVFVHLAVVPQFEDWLRRDTSRTAEMLARELDVAVATHDEEALRRIVEQEATRHDFKAALVVDASGGILGRYGEASQVGFNAVLAEGEGVLVRGDGSIGVWRPIELEGVHLGAVVLLLSPERISTIQRWTLVIGGNTILLLLLSVIFSARFSTTFVAPIEAMMIFAGRLVEGDLSARLRTSSGVLEVAALIEHLNKMASVLEQRDLKLAQRQAELERSLEALRLAQESLVSAREAALDASRAKSQFLANMSHEIRTPLNGVIGLLGLILDEELKPEIRETVDTALQSAVHLLAIINDILDLSKIEAGKLTIERASFALAPSLRDALKPFELKARAQGLNFTLEISPELPDWIAGDSVRFRQIIVNLVGNALKFTASGAVSIRAYLRREEGAAMLAVSVTDTGIGVAPDKVRQIFDAFTQADESMTRRFGGTGLGLTICRQLVELMGGRLWVESQQGAGSTFSFELPLLRAEPDQTSERIAPSGAVGPIRKLRVLVAEDNKVNQRVVQGLLERMGHDSVVVADGVDAVSAVASERFDVVLMDVQMPTMDGLAAAREIRRVEASSLGPRTPIVALTAHAMDGDAQRCLDAGMDAYLTKPIVRKILKETLDRWAPANG